MKTLTEQFEDLFIKAAKLGENARINSFAQDAIELTKSYAKMNKIQRGWAEAQEVNKECGVEHKSSSHMAGLITDFGLVLKEIREEQEKML